MDRQGLIEALGQFWMYTLEPLLKDWQTKRDLRLMTATIYAGFVAKNAYPDDSVRHNKRMDFAVRTAKEIIEQTK